MDAAPPQPGSLLLPAASAPDAEVIEVQPAPPFSFADISPSILQELFLVAEGAACGLKLEEFHEAISNAGARSNFGQPPNTLPDARHSIAFVRGLRLTDLALAAGCALGRESAWQRFMELYRAPLTQVAVAITRSESLGMELADSLYAELYGLDKPSTPVEGSGESIRRSPLASYSGRGSLLGWLRTTLAQRHVDHHRRAHRETPLGSHDVAAPAPAHLPLPAHLIYLKQAVTASLQSLGPEDRFLLSAYFLDQRTLLQIAGVLHVHEATISRRIKRLSQDLREELLLNLRLGGLSMQAAQEALGIDPRDLEINLHWLLQTSEDTPFLEQKQEQEVHAVPGKQGTVKPKSGKSPIAMGNEIKRTGQGIQ